ncbi:MAG: carbohydrate ABC transporter permease [Clostridiaceae bacterium]|nr:carbohydrate ABC transporter permease [Clostridiaceae bacterium]
MAEKYTKGTFILEVIAILIAILFLVPFYFVVANSLKPFKDIILNALSLPKGLYFKNYTEAFKILDYPKVFANSLIITLISNCGLVIISSMAAHWLVRHPKGISKVFFTLFISAMIIPFQAIMIPMVKVAHNMGWINSYYGIIFCYLGFGVSLTVFLYHGFIKGIPVELEEAAIVDGCSVYRVFWSIVFPLLKPITVTVIILNSLWIWNDFLLPLLVIPNEKYRTIPLAANAFFSQYTKQWDLALAGLVMSIIPIIILFLSLQKFIIKGITAGSVKG